MQNFTATVVAFVVVAVIVEAEATVIAELVSVTILVTQYSGFLVLSEINTS